MRRPMTLLAGMLIAVGVAGCSGVPGSGGITDHDEIPITTNVADLSGPVPGIRPEDLVRGFIEASGDPTPDARTKVPFSAARQYLAEPVRQVWQQNRTTVMVIEDNFQVSTPEVSDDGQSATLRLTANTVGTLAADRSFTRGKRITHTQDIHVKRSDGEWRIVDPPAQVLMTSRDFDRAYGMKPVYFLDATGSVVVPDLRYITVASNQTNQAEQLMELLLGGPSSALAEAVKSQLPRGATLNSNVRIDDSGQINIDLTGLEAPDGAALKALAAQLAFTLTADVGVRILLDGQDLAPQESFTPSSLASFDPTWVSGTGPVQVEAMYIDQFSRIADVSTGAVTVVGDGPTSTSRFEAASRSAASGVLAAVERTDTGVELQLSSASSLTNLQTVLSADTLTTPSFDRTGKQVWVVQNAAANQQIIRLTTTGTPTRQTVPAPKLGSLGSISLLVLSPDRSRVALVADSRLYIAPLLTATAAGETTVSIGTPHLVDPGLTNVGPVAFRSPTVMYIGAAGSAGGVNRVLWEVGVDGRTLSELPTTGITNDITAIAVPTGQAPLLVSFGRRIYQLEGRRWVSPHTTGPMDGIAPFYPN